MKWFDRYKQRWGAELSEKDINHWERQLTHSLGYTATSDKITECINGIRVNKAPPLERVMAEITMEPKQQRTKYNNKRTVEQKKGCQYCHYGWIDFRPGQGSEISLNDFIIIQPVSMPCDCEAGLSIQQRLPSFLNASSQQRTNYNAVLMAAKGQQRPIYPPDISRQGSVSQSVSRAIAHVNYNPGDY